MDKPTDLSNSMASSDDGVGQAKIDTNNKNDATSSSLVGNSSSSSCNVGCGPTSSGLKLGNTSTAGTTLQQARGPPSSLPNVASNSITSTLQQRIVSTSSSSAAAASSSSSSTTATTSTSTQQPINLNIKTTTGGNFDVRVDPNISVEHLKKVIAKQLKVSKDRICLLHRERELRDGLLKENSLMDGSKIILIPNVETGLLLPSNIPGEGNPTIAMNITAQIEAINAQQNQLREQLRSSEANLTAHRTIMMTQQNKDIENAIEAAQNTQLENLADENGISLKEFDAILQPIIESCTKDSISAGKNWILQHSTDSAKSNVVLQYLLKKALIDGSTFQQKLHLIYLVNDILHHCVRKNAQDLKNNLEYVVIPMFCSANLAASTEQRPKLTRLLTLWESKAKFFDACVISKLQSPDSSMHEYKTNLQNSYHEIIAKITQQSKLTLENYQQQHQVFQQYATQQITQLEQQKQQMEQQMLATIMPTTTPAPLQHLQQQQQLQQPQQQRSNLSQIPSLMSQKVSMPCDDDDHNRMQPNYIGVHGFSNAPPQQPPGTGNNFPTNPFSNNNFGPSTVGSGEMPMNQAPPPSSNFLIPDLSQPPPGFMEGRWQFPQQQHMGVGGNIPPTIGGMMPGNNNNAGAAINPVDLMAIKATIKLMQEQQQQQQLQQQPPLIDASLMHGGGVDDDYIPPAPKMLHADDGDIPPAPKMLHIDDGGPPIVAQILEELYQPTSAAYYDLPAGLMVPLIRLEDCTYKALDPELIRLPAPAPQDERLTNALAAFYSQPTHDRPRDAEGWEKLGLYEYYKMKNAAKKQKEEDIIEGKRERSRSPTPIIIEKPKPPKKIFKRCYRSKSRSRSKSPPPRSSPPYERREDSQSHSRSRSRSPPQSTPTHRARSRGETNRNERNSNGRHNQRNRSPKRRNSNDERESRDNRLESNTIQSGSGNGNGNGNNGGGGSSSSTGGAGGSNTSSTKRERQRSLTPPSFAASSNFAKPLEFIEESNKGHQMLKKMGWGGTGTGLGTKSQGIDQPISSGEIRDRKDMYKGVGVSLNDPFESFRKNKGAAFMHRIRSQNDKI